METTRSNLFIKFSWMWIPLVFFIVGYSGFFQTTAKYATLLFNKYADAELAKLQASGFYNELGQAEYVVGLKDKSQLNNYLDDLSKIVGVTDIENTLFSDWFVITIEKNNTGAIERIKSAEFVKFAYPNRGIWLCH